MLEKFSGCEEFSTKYKMADKINVIISTTCIEMYSSYRLFFIALIMSELDFTRFINLNILNNLRSRSTVIILSDGVKNAIKKGSILRKSIANSKFMKFEIFELLLYPADAIFNLK